ncbi:MAG: acyl-CoA dehydrogenase N-terminal domain-containing protein [Polyangiaceae bacterium]
MTTGNHYRSNLRDSMFQLFEVLDIGKTSLEKAPFTTMDESVARASLEAAEKLATQELQKSFVESDRVLPARREGERHAARGPLEGVQHVLRQRGAA